MMINSINKSHSFTNLNDDLNHKYSTKRSSSKAQPVVGAFQPPPTVTGQSKIQYLAGSLADDCYLFEEIGNDCVYQITYKKVFNKTHTDNNNNNNNNSSNKNSNSNQTFKIFTTCDEKPHIPLLPPSSNSNSTSNLNHGSNGLVYTRVKVKQLKYATLPKFIEHLTIEETGELDSSLVQTFLATYRTFADCRTVLVMIRKRYEQILPASLDMTEDVRVENLKSFRSLIKIWLENYSEDFNEPPEYVNLLELKSFVLKYMPDTELAQLTDQRLAQFKLPADAHDSIRFGVVNSNGNRHFLKNTNSFNNRHPNHNNNNNKHQLENGARPKANSLGANHRRSYSSFTEKHADTTVMASLIMSKESSNMASAAANLRTKEKSSSNNFLNALFGGLNLNNEKLSSSNSNLNNPDDSHATSTQLKSNDNFMSLDSNYIAEQLTYIDKCLFQKVCAHHCLGSVWGTRHQKQYMSRTSQVTLNSANSINGDLGVLTDTAGNSGDASKSSATSISAVIDKFAPIRAFIDQFNCVSFVVQATVLEHVDLKASERAKVIKKWIEIAQECRKYKNFSALNAIVQGLNTQCVSRLEKTWNEVPSDTKTQFNELTEMFSQDHNQRIFREILMRDLNEYKALLLYDPSDQNSNYDSDDNTTNSNNHLTAKNNDEGTAKYADINIGINATLSRKMKEKMIKQQIKYRQNREPVGTIPFLGTFLKDLEYIHAQNPTKNDKGQINVMQKRKEFEIIAQIKLLQQAAQLYRIKEDPSFKKWLYNQPIYEEAQYYELSYMIEPKFDRESSYLSANGSSSNRKPKTSISQGSRSESIESISSYNMINQNLTNQTNIVNSNSLINSLTSRTSSSNSKNYAAKRGDAHHSRNSSMESSDILDPALVKSGIDSPLMFKKSISSENNNGNINNNNNMHQPRNLEPFTTLHKYTKSSTASIINTTSSSEIRVKVNIENTAETTSGTSILYKKMSINDKYRTKDVKRLILEKFFLNPDLCDKYQLVQILDPDNYKPMNAYGTEGQMVNELVINDNCNVYYAAKNMLDMLFVLRKKNGAIGFTKNNSSLMRNNSSQVVYNGGLVNGSLSNQNHGFQAGSSPNLQRIQRGNAMYASSGNYPTRNGSVSKNIYDQRPPQAPNYNKHKNGGLNGSGGLSADANANEANKNWKFFKKILS